VQQQVVETGAFAPAAPRAQWLTARNVLCVRVDNLGDVLMTTPAIRALKAGLPGRRITLLTSASGAEAARYVPDIDFVIRHDAPWVKRPACNDAAADRALVEALAAARFDAAVIFTVYSQSPLPAALMCRLAGIPLTLAHCRENPYDLLTDWVPETEPAKRVRHEVQRQLDLVATVGAAAGDDRMSFVVPPPDDAAIDGLLQCLGVALEAPLIAVHPGASAASRRYPADSFSAAVRDLVQRRDARIVVTGSANERELAERVCAGGGPRARNLAGRLGLGGLAALIARADVLISNNTGPVHVAAALGTPVVDLYALTNPQHTPWRVPNRVLFRDVPCRYCYKSVCPEGHHQCLRGVTPAEIVSAVEALLDDEREGRATPAARASRTLSGAA
jgi:lipopolysaccharide heptosyltransferase II